MINGNEMLQKINYLNKKKTEKNNVSFYIVFPPLGICSHSLDRDFISLYQGSYSTSTNARSQLTPVIYICQAVGSLVCTVPEPPPRRHTPATARSSPKDAEVHVHTGSEDYVHRIKTINIILTILAKIAEGKLSKCPLL